MGMTAIEIAGCVVVALSVRFQDKAGPVPGGRRSQ